MAPFPQPSAWVLNNINGSSWHLIKNCTGAKFRLYIKAPK